MRQTSFRQRQARRDVLRDLMSVCGVVAGCALLLGGLCAAFVLTYALKVGTGQVPLPSDARAFDMAVVLCIFSALVLVVSVVFHTLARLARA